MGRSGAREMIVSGNSGTHAHPSHKRAHSHHHHHLRGDLCTNRPHPKIRTDASAVHHAAPAGRPTAQATPLSNREPTLNWAHDVCVVGPRGAHLPCHANTQPEDLKKIPFFLGPTSNRDGRVVPCHKRGLSKWTLNLIDRLWSRHSRVVSQAQCSHGCWVPVTVGLCTPCCTLACPSWSHTWRLCLRPRK